jgi:hypothetical protein
MPQDPMNLKTPLIKIQPPPRINLPKVILTKNQRRILKTNQANSQERSQENSQVRKQSAALEDLKTPRSQKLKVSNGLVKLARLQEKRQVKQPAPLWLAQLALLSARR